jgi:hypothetical protein
MHQMRISTTLRLFSDAQVEKVEKPGEKMWKLKEPSDENQTECHEIEPNPSHLGARFVIYRVRTCSVAHPELDKSFALSTDSFSRGFFFRSNM